MGIREEQNKQKRLMQDSLEDIDTIDRRVSIAQTQILEMKGKINFKNDQIESVEDEVIENNLVLDTLK